MRLCRVIGVKSKDLMEGVVGFCDFKDNGNNQRWLGVDRDEMGRENGCERDYLCSVFVIVVGREQSQQWVFCQLIVEFVMFFRDGDLNVIRKRV